MELYKLLISVKTMPLISSPTSSEESRLSRMALLIRGSVEQIKIFGDTYLLRKTFDIIDDRGSIYGYDVFDANNCFLRHYDTEDKKYVVSEIMWDIYRILS